MEVIHHILVHPFELNNIFKSEFLNHWLGWNRHSLVYQLKILWKLRELSRNIKSLSIKILALFLEENM